LDRGEFSIILIDLFSFTTDVSINPDVA